MGKAEIPFGAAGFYLLGKICRLTSNMTEAKDYYYRALQLNPLLWSAHEELCAVGGDDEAAEACSKALAHARANMEGPGALTNSQVSSGLGQHLAQSNGALLGKDRTTRTAAQQHTPAGPAGTSGATPSNGPQRAPVGSMGFGAPNRGAPQGLPTFGGFGFGAAASAAAGGSGAGGHGGGGGGGLLFQTPVGNPGGLFASPIPSFGGFGLGAPSSGPPSSAVPGTAQGHGAGGPGLLWVAQQGNAAGGAASGGDGAGGGPPSTGPQMFQFGAGMFATPSPAGLLPQPPAPPQKQQGPQAGEAGSLPSGSGENPHGRGSSGGAPVGHQRISRMVDEGKVRKVSNKLFSDPRSSVRRSQRLAALNSAAAATQGVPSGPAAGQHPQLGAGYGLSFGPTPSAQGQTGKPGQASFVEYGRQGDSQNMPDPRDPPPAPVQQQLHPDAKLRGPGAAPAQLQHPTTFGSRMGPGTAPGGADQGNAAAAAESRAALLQLLAPLMDGVRHLAAYRCKEAVSALMRLPIAQYRTAWVQCALGRAHFEGMDYQKAAQCFETARQLDRTRVEGMELYSTVLWHTKREYELSHLAQEMVATDRLAPQTWCVMGNLFSSQKEHEAAIEFFLRAVQVDPAFTYAFTLAGHEYTANEDYDKGIAMYRAAVKLDPRHYNALYGLGQIAYRQEKYGEALQHFRMASSINPRSSVLRCYCGMSAAKLGQHHLALDKLQEAIELDPANPLARFERSAVLASLDRIEEALTELEALLRVAPGEASVPFQMGKLYKRLSDLTKAQQAYELALSYNSCSSSDAAMIKAAIERLSMSEDEEEEEV